MNIKVDFDSKRKKEKKQGASSTPRKARAHDFHERSSRSANLQVYLPKTKQKINIKAKEKVDKLCSKLEKRGRK